MKGRKMNVNFRKVARFATLLILLAALAVMFSSYTASRAAEARTPLAAKPAKLDAANAISSYVLQEDPPGVDPELLQRLRQSAQGSTSISARKSTGFAGFVRVSQDGDLLPAGGRRAPQAKATGFLAEYGRLFGAREASSELTLVSTAIDRSGTTHLAYQQVYNGVPVFAGVLRVHLDAAGKLTAVNGAFVPDLDLNTSPALAPEAAAGRAVEAVLANPPSDEEHTDAFVSLSAGDLSVESTTLYVYRDGLIQDVPGANLLVYRVVVTNGASLREVVFVNAHSGKVVNRYSATQDALFRRLFEMNTTNQVWQEGDAFPGSLNQDQQNIVTFSGHAYYLFFNTFGRDSYDAAGAEMQSVNNDPRINCPNANWNGATTNYCNGVTSDDVVAHEWGHAYTQYTHDLIYQWQSGALNESYSDIWGEVVDMLNGEGTDAPADTRTVNTCSEHTTPIPVLVINSPANIAGDYAAAGAAFGPALTQAGITGNVVVGIDGSGPSPTDGCEPLTNAAAVNGNIALVDRGTCAFTFKVKTAQNAGATAVIVANNTVGPPAPMGGADPTINIPSVMVAQSTGNLIKEEQANGVNATMRLGGGTVEDSYRWLMGEDSTAFGGAIRDMWAPTCLGDPGKVTDAQYFCATTDGGGVHTNSGVPNHGFALLVDGGTYNGQTINAIGLVKAAHIYWRAQSVYQTPSSNFVDHADALEASCADLIGDPLEDLSTGTTPGGPSGESITAADCAEVSEMIAAVELRTDPSAQCNFQPILQPDPPPVCTTGTPTTLLKEEFGNLKKWTLTNQGVFSGWPGFDWVRRKNLPGGRGGTAAFATDPVAGNCDGGAGDISGMMSMTSRAIRIARGVQVVPRLVFKHYVATEAGWDGGNLKISINGGPFELVPATAYLFNPYNMTLQTAAAGNTNPLAGQPAFSGTDGGELTGSWGESQIDLESLGVELGDTIRLRYDFGMDGCNGNDGWYVDDVQLIACKP
jgi:Zn-dependent metalloprotease